MPDHIHTAESHPEHENAGCCKSAGTSVPQSGTVPDFPDVKLSFSLSGFLLLLLVGYKRFISPLLPRCCRFTPTCSAYAAEAVMVHGPFKGIMLAAWRLMRCQPFCKGGYDPVPPRKTKSNHRESSEQ